MIVRNEAPDIPTSKMNLSFSGCGFLGLYHMGVACCFRQYCPQICHNQISGASAGALVATALACNLNLGKSASHILEVAIKARHRALGPFHPNFDINEIMLNALNDVLPQNAHELVSDKLNISVTRVSDGKNCILNKFQTRAELIQAILCSCFIPFWSGYIPPKFQGVAYIDGGFSNNLLIHDENTITVSPFSGESDICPVDNTYNSYQINISNTSISISPGNIYRLTRILFPPHPEVMDKMCQQGFQDALRFLQRNNKISCTRCVAVQLAYKMEDEDENTVEPLIGGRDSPSPQVNEQVSDTVIEQTIKEALEYWDVDDDFDQSELSTDKFKETLDKLGKNIENLLNNGTSSVRSKFDHLTDEQLDQQIQKMIKLNQRIRRIQKSKHKHAKNTEGQENCLQCDNLRKELVFGQLPENVANAIQEACDKVNKGLINYIFKFRIVKIISTLSVPYVLPFDITLLMLCRLKKMLPTLTNEISASLRRLLEFVLDMLSRLESGQHLNENCLANFRYQVAVTEFDYSEEQQKEQQEEKPTIVRKISTKSLSSPETEYKQTEERRPTIEKSHSFKIVRNRSTEELDTLRRATRRNSMESKARPHRKSYAGTEHIPNVRDLNRKTSSNSVVNCKPTERILSKMKLGFSMDLSDIEKMSSNGDLSERQPDLVASSRTNSTSSMPVPEASVPEHRLSSASMPTSLQASPAQVDAHSVSFEEKPIQIANKALNKGIDDLSLAAPRLDRLNNRLKEITANKEALLAFHYKDEDNVVKVTEIFNFSDEEESNQRNKKHKLCEDDVSQVNELERPEADAMQMNANSKTPNQSQETSENEEQVFEPLTEDGNNKRQRKSNVIFRH